MQDRNSDDDDDDNNGGDDDGDNNDGGGKTTFIVAAAIALRLCGRDGSAHWYGQPTAGFLPALLGEF